MKNLSIIVAITRDFAIGKGNDLLTYIPGDLKRFKEITSWHTVIMGRKTLLSLPKWPLVNRRNIVLSKDAKAQFEGCEVLHSVQAVAKAVRDEDEAFVIGGGQVYKAFLPYVDKLYLTVVHKTLDADTYFPVIDWSQWNEVERLDIKQGEKTDFAYSYITLVRK